MTLGLQSPLLEFFKRGEAAADVRLLAAQGALVAPALDQLLLIVMLSSDRDPEIRDMAEATLTRMPTPLLARFLARSEAPQELRDFFIRRGVQIAVTPLPDGEELLPVEDDTDYGPEPTTDRERLMVAQRVAAMSIPEKLKAAMRGSREMRAILIRDPHKMIALMVLRSPKITESEIEMFAKMGSVDTDVLRTISQTRAWIKNYHIAHALVKNAKTPLAISLSLMPRLVDADLRRLSMDRNVPEALRIAARKKVVIDR
jgi:hypothetical protein